MHFRQIAKAKATGPYGGRGTFLSCSVFPTSGIPCSRDTNPSVPSPPPHSYPNRCIGRPADKCCALRNYKGTLPPSPGAAAQISADFPQPNPQPLPNASGPKAPTPTPKAHGLFPPPLLPVWGLWPGSRTC